MKVVLSAVLSVVLAAGCGGGGPTLAPGEVDLSLNSLNESDFLAPGLLEKDENIGNGNADPWGDFIDRAVAECGGDPDGFEVTDVFVTLDPTGSSGVAALEDLASGSLSVHLLDTSGSDADALRVEIGSLEAPTGLGPVALDVTAGPAALDGLAARMVGGDFHLGVRVETGLDDQDVFSADLRISFGLVARCP